MQKGTISNVQDVKKTSLIPPFFIPSEAINPKRALFQSALNSGGLWARVGVTGPTGLELATPSTEKQAGGFNICCSL